MKLHTAKGPAVAQRRPETGRSRLVCRAEVRARWCLDVRFGRKAEGTSLLQEWVKDVGVPAGLSARNTRLSSGAIGVPESRLELEVTFPSTSDWERFLGSVSAKEHKAWSQRVQSMVVDGSPAWHVYRTVPLEVEGTEAKQSEIVLNLAPPAAPARENQQQPQQVQQSQQEWQPSPSLLLDELNFDEIIRAELGNKRPQGEGNEQTPQSIQLPGVSVGGDLAKALQEDDELKDVVAKAGEDVDVVLDWKGDPMVIAPGDRMPKWL